jgi:hypothetical protein
MTGSCSWRSVDISDTGSVVAAGESDKTPGGLISP